MAINKGVAEHISRVSENAPGKHPRRVRIIARDQLAALASPPT